MKRLTSFLVRGTESYKSFTRLLIDNRVLRSCIGLDKCVTGIHRLGDGERNLVVVDTGSFSDLQEKQKVDQLQPPSLPTEALHENSIRMLLVTKSIHPKMEPDEVEEFNTSLDSVRRELRGMEIAYREIEAYKLSPACNFDFNLVGVLGGDGTFLHVGRSLENGFPIFGINANPHRSYGHYLKTRGDDFNRNLSRLISGDYIIYNLPRIQPVLTRGERSFNLPLLLNEVAIKDYAPFKATRCVVQVAGREEFIYSDGMLISSSSASRPGSWALNADGIMLGEGSSLIQLTSFAPGRIAKNGEQNLLCNFITGEPVTVVSENRFEPLIGVDSAESFDFPRGDRLLVTGVVSPLRFIDFPEKLSSSEVDALAYELQDRRAFLDDEIIRELERTSLCTAVKPGEKNQILFLQIAPDLSNMKIWAIKKLGEKALGAEDILLLEEVNHPLLLYPTAEIAAKASTERDMIFNLYRYGNYITEMNGVVVEWNAEEDKNVWGPSIDTVFFLHTLHKHGLFKDSVLAASEIGTGNGMLAKGVTMFCHNLEDMEITDINFNALKCAGRNIRRGLNKSLLISSFHSPGTRKIFGRDLLIINPPYVPKKRAEETNPYEGTGLIKEIIENRLKLLKRENPDAAIVINYSSLAQKDFDSYMEGVDDVNVELLETLTVPLKINWASIDPEWMEYLLTECGLELRDESIYGYKYWHTLKIVKITKKDT